MRQPLETYKPIESILHEEDNKRTWGVSHLNCVLSLIIVITLIIIAGSIIPLAGDAQILINDAGQTLADMNIIIPEVKETLKMVNRLCEYENFTTNYGFICDW